MPGNAAIGLTLSESLSGSIGMGESDPALGYAAGEQTGCPLSFEVVIAIESVADFIHDRDHKASLSGLVRFGTTGEARPIEHGEFNVFSIDPATGHRQMTYEFAFSLADGARYCLLGQKHLYDDPGFDIIDDLTRLWVTLHAGDNPEGPPVGAGQLFFSLKNAPALLASMTVTGPAGFAEKLSTKIAFLSFVFGQVRDVYLADINPLYTASYQNLVLSGELLDEQTNRVPCFLVSGIHSPGFPWGDGEVFADLLLILGNADQPQRRFALSARSIDSLQLDLVGGSFFYAGPLYELVDRSSVTFSEMHAPTAALPVVQAHIELHFAATRHELAPIPFHVRSELLDRLATRLRDTLQRILPSESLFGFQLLPHSVAIESGTLELIELTDAANRQKYRLDAQRSYGEAEDSTLCSVREPTLLYGYLCAPDAESRRTTVQFHASSLRNERNSWVKDRLDAWLGAIISHFVSKQLVIDADRVTVTDLASAEDRSRSSERLRCVGPVLLEVANDHFPTAVFQRRIVTIEDHLGRRRLALEEAMDPLRRESINSDRVTIVAAVRDVDKCRALLSAINAAGIFPALEGKCAALGKSRAALQIAIKPNFMFAYDRCDHSTYTDPELVACLVDALRLAGYRQIKVVEAQSTYGEYFDARTVHSVAEYLGYSVDGSAGYELVDLTEDAWKERQFGPHLGVHPVPLTWSDADFRVSFAKNKTHSYAYYTLTLKNIYGALCLANKFKEYHIDRDIYQTTIEYLQAYPVDFGIIDAHLSADGPFGIFADTDPNRTETILAGCDLVAVDWVGASKMGLDPRVSPHMRFAVAAFGKPRIELIGDASLYRPWLNVPHTLSLLAHHGIDANYHFGNLFYLAASHMDPAAFRLKPTSTLATMARAALAPVRDAAFLQAGGHRSWANLALGKLLNWLGS